MHRHLNTVFLAFIAIGLVFASPAFAGDQDLRQQIQELEKRIDVLSDQQSTQLEQTIESYLDKSSAWKSADGADQKNITISAALTVNFFGTLDMDPNNRHTMSGDVDIGFHFQVTDNVSINVLTVAAAGGGTASTVNSFAGTYAGASDGIGTNGNASTTGTGRALNVDEAAVTVNRPDNNMTIEFGALDPRRRVLQNKYADNENTQFLNNLFDDVSSVLWQTSAAGGGVLGLHISFAFGDNDDYSVSVGWYNGAGAFFSKGSLFIQFTAHIAGDKDMNIRVMVNLDHVNNDAGGDATVAWGISWDMAVNDEIGVFVRIAGNDDDAARGNPVEFEASFGGQMAQGDEGNVVGIAIALVQANETLLGVLPEDLEITLEVYYLMNLEGGKLQITPFFMYVQDPAGGGAVNDSLFILGFRVHVPF